MPKGMCNHHVKMCKTLILHLVILLLLQQLSQSPQTLEVCIIIKTVSGVEIGPGQALYFLPNKQCILNKNSNPSDISEEVFYSMIGTTANHISC